MGGGGEEGSLLCDPGHELGLPKREREKKDENNTWGVKPNAHMQPVQRHRTGRVLRGWRTQSINVKSAPCVCGGRCSYRHHGDGHI